MNKKLIIKITLINARIPLSRRFFNEMRCLYAKRKTTTNPKRPNQYAF